MKEKMKEEQEKSQKTQKNISKKHQQTKKGENNGNFEKQTYKLN